MVRKYVLGIIVSVMFFALAVLSGIIPGEAGKTVSMFLLPLAAAILTGILAGSINGLLVAFGQSIFFTVFAVVYF